jgi:POT family proton-dependent oligopeptide transporter
MLAALATYLYGYRYLPVRVGRHAIEGGGLTAADWRTVGTLIAVMAIGIFPSTAFFQLFNVYPVWIQQYVASDVGGLRIPIPWYQSINALASVLVVPPLFWLWRKQAARGQEPGDFAKIAIGSWIAAASSLTLVAAMFVPGGKPIHPVWPFLYSVGMGVAFIHYWPTLLALVSRAAPAKVNATLMGIVFMTLFIASNLIGWLGSLYERMSPAEFWTLHAAIAAAGGLLVAVFGRRLDRVLRDPAPAQR